MRRTIVAAATAAVLLISGCGGNDDSAGAAGEKTTVRLGFSAWPGWFPWQVAQEQGLFASGFYTAVLAPATAGTNEGTAPAAPTLEAEQPPPHTPARDFASPEAAHPNHNSGNNAKPR